MAGCARPAMPDLADKMLRFAEMPDDQKQEMGRQSQLKAGREFDERLTINSCLETVHQALLKDGVRS
jgi:hypothetical protein